VEAGQEAEETAIKITGKEKEIPVLREAVQNANIWINGMAQGLGSDASKCVCDRR